MPIKLNYYIVIDLETTGLDTNVIQPIEIAGKVINSRSLEPIPGAEFCELCRPTKDCQINPEVYEKTGITAEMVENAPSIEVVWPKFHDFIMKYNPEKNTWTAPIAVGYNIARFDLPIANRMNDLFLKKSKKTVMFNPVRHIDLYDIFYLWFENTNDVPGMGLDAMRSFFGISSIGSHRAMKDVDDVITIFSRFLRWHRELAEQYLPKMKNAFKKNKEIPL